MTWSRQRSKAAMLHCGAAARLMLLLTAVLIGALPTQRARAQGEDVEALRKQVEQLVWPSRVRDKTTDELIAVASRYVDAARASYGHKSTEYAGALNALAQFRFWAGQYAEADALFRAELAVREPREILGNSKKLADKGRDFYNRGAPFDAYPYGLAAADAALKTSGEASPAYAQALDYIVVWHTGMASLEQAEKYARAAIEVTERMGGREDVSLIHRLHNLVSILRRRHGVGITDEIEAQYERLITLWEKLAAERKLNQWELGNGQAYFVGLLVAYKEAVLYFDDRARLASLVATQRRALLASERIFGANDKGLIAELVLLAGILKNTGHVDEAEQHLRRALAIADSQSVDGRSRQTALRHLSAILVRSGRGAEAVTIYRNAISSLASDREFGTILLSELAQLQASLGRRRDAEFTYVRAIALTRPVATEYWQNERRASLRVGLGELYADQGRATEAEASFAKALLLDPGYQWPGVGSPVDRLASLHAKAGRWHVARYYLRKVKPPLFDAKVETSLARFDRLLTGEDAKEPDVRSLALSKEDRLLNIIRATYHAGRGAAEELRASMVSLQSEELTTKASLAVQQMAVRFAKGTGEDARLVRARQDALDRADKLDRPDTGVFPHDEAARRRKREESARLRADLAKIDATLKDSFPALQLLLAPQPVPVEEIQALLSPEEALVVTADLAEAASLPEETFVWVVTKTDARWVRSALGTTALTEHVAALRCGLDATLWLNAKDWPEANEEEAEEKAAQVRRRQLCKSLVKAEPTPELITPLGPTFEVLPFDTARAHLLYRALFGEVEDLIKGKSLLVVPSGPLTSLPFSVLVTAPPATAIPATLADYRAVPWLGTRQAVATLPSVASLKALRGFAKKSLATRPLLGVGNPLLEGRPGHDPEDAVRAALAVDRRDCGRHTATEVALQAKPGPTYGFKSVFRGAYADVAKVREWKPLPETASELCEVARRLGVPDGDILLGSRASEGAIKDLSASGKLMQYQILHFATHGALSGEVDGSAEPGLILTPPDPRAGPADLERDDGYLTASEIAGLKLDASWVILSACNTAAGTDEHAEALSGLARAFFYAGARALLVSHWEVGSDVAVRLTTHAFRVLQARPEIGRSEAFRLSMREAIENGRLWQAHPSQWAPFVLVGEGGAQR